MPCPPTRTLPTQATPPDDVGPVEVSAPNHPDTLTARLIGVDVLVRNTLAMVCLDTCAGGTFGIGVVVDGRSALDLTRFAVLESALAGIMVTNAGEADLHQGQISGSPIGISLQSTRLDVTRLTDGVVFRA